MKNIGNTYFLTSSKDVFDLSVINIDHIVRVYSVDYFFYEDDDVEMNKCYDIAIAILLIGNNFLFLGERDGAISDEVHGFHRVVGNSELVREIKKLFLDD